MIKTKVILSHNLLCLLRRGQKEILNYSTHEKIGSDQLLLLTKGSVLMTESLTDGGRFESILFFFSRDFLENFCFRYHVSLKDTSADMKSIFALGKDEFIFNYENSLELLRPTVHDQSLQRLKLEEFLLYLKKKYPGVLDCFLAEALKSNSAQKLKQTVLANLEKKLTISELAFLCNMSVSSFKRYFTEVFHASPKKYFTQYRMQKAWRLLKSGNHPSAIHLDLGYENLSSFSTEFKKHFGLSPRQVQFEPTAKVIEQLG